jgi:hypothetical protein
MLANMRVLAPRYPQGAALTAFCLHWRDLPLSRPFRGPILKSPGIWRMSGQSSFSRLHNKGD